MSIDLAIGQEFGNYRLTKRLGRGGFAEVYLGEHVYLQTQKAIKVLQARLEHEEQERFNDEARIVARLQHEHIVRVLEFGLKDDSVPYLVMDYAPNGTLRERFPRGTAVPLEHILQPVKQVAAALDYAHSTNLIHRDIKPENMLLGTQNEVLLSDFGIALMVSGSRHQGVQDVAGTIIYMAPEQLRGHPTKASDQYALGVVVYEWLTGRRLFSGSFTEVATQHILKSPPSLQEHGIPAAVDQAVLKALAKEPEQRFPTVQDFANALEAAAKGQTYIIREKITPPNNIDVHVTNKILSTLSFRLDLLFTHLLQDRKQAKSSSGIIKIALVALVLLLIIGGGLAYVLSGAKKATGVKTEKIANTAQSMQALYTSATSGEPQIDDPLSAESPFGWSFLSNGNCVFKGGALHALHSGETLCVTEATNLNNFAYQAEMTIIQGAGGGLIFRENLQPNQIGIGGDYYVTVTTQGQLVLSQLTVAYVNKQIFPAGSHLQDLIAPSYTSAIKPGLGQTNLLTVITRGPSIYLYINKRFVGSAQDSTLLSGTIGMFGGSSTADGKAVDVAFRNLKVWALW